MSEPEARMFDIDRFDGYQDRYRELHDVIPEPGSIRDIGEVATALYQIAEATRGANLPNTHFAYVYALLSKNIDNKIETYDNPDALNKTSGIFGEAFWEPVRLYAEGVLEDDVEKLQQIPEHWRLAFFAPKVRESLPVLQFYMGMTAHIEGDLAQVLADSGVDDSYYHDYTYKVGDEIRDTSRELAPELVPGPGIVASVALPVVTRSIAKERQDAWDGSKEIMVARSVGDMDREFSVIHDLEHKASRRINRVRHLGGIATTATQLLGWNIGNSGKGVI